MIRPITAWYRWDSKKKAWIYNHVEFALGNATHPEPISAEQQGWNKLSWACRYGIYQKALGRTRVIEQSPLIIP